VNDGTRCFGAFSTGEEERKTDGESRRTATFVVDARGGNSHEAGGVRLAVLNLSPDSDWPCMWRSLVTVLLLDNWRGAEFLKPLVRRVSPDGFLPLFLLSPLSLSFR